MIQEGYMLFGRKIDIVDDGITAEDLGELLEKLHWCMKVGLIDRGSPMRIQPYTWCMLHGVMQMTPMKNDYKPNKTSEPKKEVKPTYANDSSLLVTACTLFAMDSIY